MLTYAAGTPSGHMQLLEMEALKALVMQLQHEKLLLQSNLTQVLYMRRAPVRA